MFLFSKLAAFILIDLFFKTFSSIFGFVAAGYIFTFYCHGMFLFSKLAAFILIDLFLKTFSSLFEFCIASGAKLSFRLSVEFEIVYAIGKEY